MRELTGTVAKGALLGLCWGVIARLWMRFISTSPEFTWSGTAYVLAAPTIIGALAGLALTARRREWRLVWLARVGGGGSMVLLGLGAGVIMLPTLLFGTLAVARTAWPRWIRATLAMLALVPVTGVLPELWIFDPVRAAAAAFCYLALVGAMILILRVSFAPASSPVVPSSPPGARVRPPVQHDQVADH